MSLPGANPSTASQLREEDSQEILLNLVMQPSPLLVSRAAQQLHQVICMMLESMERVVADPPQISWQSS